MERWKFSSKVFGLGVLLYFSPKSVFFKFATRWFPDPKAPDDIMEPLANWRANFQVKYGSGLPYTSSGSDVVNDARLPSKLNVDLRLNKRIPLPGTVSMDFFIDVYNLFDRKNVDWIGGSYSYLVTGEYSVIRLREDTGELVRNPQTLNEERQFRFGLAVQF